MEDKKILSLLNDLCDNIDFRHRNFYVHGFLLFLYYKKIITAKESSINDIEQSIKSSTLQNKEELLEIWSRYNQKCDSINEYLKLLSSYDLSQFNSPEDEKTIINSTLDRYFSFIILRDAYFNSEITINIISKCEKQLGVEFNKGNILVNTGNFCTIRFLLTNQSDECIYTFYRMKQSLKDAINIYKIIFAVDNIAFLDSDDDESVVPSSGFYDGVIIDTDFQTNLERDDHKVTFEDYPILNIVKEGGFALVCDYETKKTLGKSFFEYEVPLMIEHWNEQDGNSILIIKKKDETSLVRYCQNHFINDEYIDTDTDTIVNEISEWIKNRIENREYQELKKEDFSITRKVRFSDVIHPSDQKNFVWKKKSDIISIIEDKEEWVYNTRINDKQIINVASLSGDSFRIAADSHYYLNGFVNEKCETPHILSECSFTRTDKHRYDFEFLDKHVEDLFENRYLPSKEVLDPDKREQIDTALTCRIVKSPCLLYSEFFGVLRVDASESTPVCFKKYSFRYDPYEGISCVSRCDVIKIKPEYDENFIIHQLLNENKSYNNEYILVAPTKEEQHTYFLNKRLDYTSKFQSVVEEMEEEVSKSFYESPARITGVGFENFRRFTSLPTLSFSGVNMMVGANNAGKSSLVKGMLLAIDNIKSYIVDIDDKSAPAPEFHFDTRNYHDLSVGTFVRSYSHNAKGHKHMTFSLSCAHFEISLCVEPSYNDASVSVPVTKISVKDKKREAEFTFDFKNLTSSYSFSIEGDLFENKNVPLYIPVARQGESLISLIVRGILPKDDKNIYEKLKSKAGFILEIAAELDRVVKNIDVEYIYAHGVSQKVLFNIGDKNDYMAQTLRDFVVEKTGDVEDRFIKKCLKEFGLGTDYDVHSIGGEAYIIEIKNNIGKMVYLADLGMGANQLVILIFRLATIIHRHRMKGSTPYKPTIIIEEPEQNMHPAFQSKLATLFYEVNRDYGFSFIVETHSEYLIRKSQVIVAQQKYADSNELNEKSPFMVYYFPSDGNPYPMEYRTDGNFSNEFGSGFYDEANNLLFEIL